MRQILGVPLAFVSRVSNATVFARAGVQSLEKPLLRSQFDLLGKAAQAPPGSAMRRNIFLEDTLRLVVGHFVQRVGRPRQAWTTSLMQIGGADLKEKLKLLTKS